MASNITTNTDLADTDSASQTTTATTIFSLPTELNLSIYERVFSRRSFWPQFDVFDEVFFNSHSHGPDSRAAIPLVLSNRRMYEQVMSVLYGQVRVDITVHDSYQSSAQGVCIGATSQVMVWPYLHKIDLHLRFTRHGDTRVLIQRLSELLIAIEMGRHLGWLLIRFIWDDRDPVPPGIDEVIRELRVLEFTGRLNVDVDGNLDIDETMEMERTIEHAIMS